jgi:RNA polymerase-binding transcription factor DksA
MNDTTIYQEKLTDEKAALEQELNTVAKRDPQNHESWEAVQTEITPEADPNDQATQLDEYQENRAIVDVLNARYQEVSAALTRIEEGTYGTCEEGSEQIEEDRLGADPAARTCKEHMQ